MKIMCSVRAAIWSESLSSSRAPLPATCISYCLSCALLWHSPFLLSSVLNRWALHCSVPENPSGSQGQDHRLRQNYQAAPRNSQRQSHRYFCQRWGHKVRVTEGMNSFVLGSSVGKRRQIGIRIMTWKCLLARAANRLGAVEFTLWGAAAGMGVLLLLPWLPWCPWPCVAVLGRGNVHRGAEAFPGIGLLVHRGADLTLPLKGALRRCPSLWAHATLLFINLETILWQVVVSSGKMSWVLKVKLHKVLKV